MRSDVFVVDPELDDIPDNPQEIIMDPENNGKWLNAKSRETKKNINDRIDEVWKAVDEEVSRE